MRACKVTITTLADGVENSIARNGEMDLSALGGILRYTEENASVEITLKDETATVERQGDYSLLIPLKKDVLCNGQLGICGNVGDVQTYTHKIAYTTTKDSLLLVLHYDLIISGETQKMRLRLLARYVEGEQYEN